MAALAVAEILTPDELRGRLEAGESLRGIAQEMGLGREVLRKYALRTCPDAIPTHGRTERSVALQSAIWEALDEAEGQGRYRTNADIAAELGCSDETVRKWRAVRGGGTDRDKHRRWQSAATRGEYARLKEAGQTCSDCGTVGDAWNPLIGGRCLACHFRCLHLDLHAFFEHKQYGATVLVDAQTLEPNEAGLAWLREELRRLWAMEGSDGRG